MELVYVVKGKELRVNVENCYVPSDDTHLAQLSLEYLPIKDKVLDKVKLVIDVGCGCGILGLTLIYLGIGKEFLFIDIDYDSCKTCLSNLRKNNCGKLYYVICTWGLLPLKQGIGKKNNLLIISIPPYLPLTDEDSFIDKHYFWSIDEEGTLLHEHIIEFSQKYPSLTLLVFSSLSPKTNSLIKEFSGIVCAKKHMFFEDIIVCVFKFK